MAGFKKERAAEVYAEGKVPISGTVDMAGPTIPEMVEYLVSRGYRSGYSPEAEEE